MKQRIHQIELFMKYPHEVQQELFTGLVKTAKNTSFGKDYGFKDFKSVEAFRERVPIVTYEQLFPYIDRLLHGEQNVLWPSDVRWFAKSSGTTNARSKFIPVTQEALEDCHFKAGKDMLSLYCNNNPDTKIFTGKGLGVGGSQQVNKLNKNAKSNYGDVSAVIMKNLPLWVKLAKTPSLDVALMDKWEEKIEIIAQQTANENVTSMAGVPTWTAVIIKRILEITGKTNMLEVWPNMEVFFHGAVSFAPYKGLFRSFFPSDQVNYMETYNASEGFFGLQDQSDSEEMLLMLDYGVFYEFIPMANLDDENPQTLGLEEVTLDAEYALVISTNAGLWRYRIGDTIRFTSLDPFRIKISGRTRHYINAFGEEVNIENAERAITRACEQTAAILENFTAAPKFIDTKEKGCHEWIIEFAERPSSIEKFTNVLDSTLRELNSDYDAKRYKDIALHMPIVHQVEPGTFQAWMSSRGKLGGQNKVPRLANNRDYVDSIFEMLASINS